MKLLKTDYTGYLNLGSGETSSVGDIVDIISELSNKQIKSLDIPVDGVMEFKTDISLLEKLTNWKSKFSLKEGLLRTFNTMKSELNKEI